MGTMRRNPVYFPRMKFRARKRLQRQSKWIIRIWNRDWQPLGEVDLTLNAVFRIARPSNEEVNDEWACETP